MRKQSLIQRVFTCVPFRASFGGAAAAAIGFLLIASTLITGCSQLLEGDAPSEGTIVDPGNVTNYSGAVRVYYAAIDATTLAINAVTRESALLTDELTGAANDWMEIDGRFNVSSPLGIPGRSYTPLHTARVTAAQAVQLLKEYGTTASKPLIGHAYALQAYAITLLAEQFCSGIPLTAVPLGGGLEYTRGFSTAELLERAVELYDSAYVYGKDSLPIATLALVGKGRALLGLGRYAEAKTAVADVTTDAKSIIEFTTIPSGGSGGMYGRRFWMLDPNIFEIGSYTVGTPEGINGIRWALNGGAIQDPRVPTTTFLPLQQLKYPVNSGTSLSFPIADGIEARMIEAEAQLHESPIGPWLATLNAARATLVQDGVRLLMDTTDPGTPASRVDLVFRERAMWFYLNGQRLGDMRRLVRQYARVPEQVYPVGAFPNGVGGGHPTYGNEFMFIPPRSEQDNNPLYAGCITKRP